MPEVPDKVVDVPDLSLLGNFNVLGSWQTGRARWSCSMFVFTLLLTDFFDTMGTMVAVAQEGDLLDEDGMPPRVPRRSCSSTRSRRRPAARRARRATPPTSRARPAWPRAPGPAFANLVTGGLFLLAMFLAPLVTIVPFEAASTALVVVGFLMMTAVRNIDWTDYEIAIPAFLTIVIMPFTYSISNGIGAGVISYVLIKAGPGQGSARSTRCCGSWRRCSCVYFLRGVLEQTVL